MPEGVACLKTAWHQERGIVKYQEKHCMPETPQQYTERILGYVKGSDVLKIQRSTGKKLKKLIQGLSNKELARQPAQIAD